MSNINKTKQRVDNIILKSSQKGFKGASAIIPKIELDDIRKYLKEKGYTNVSFGDVNGGDVTIFIRW